MMSRIWQFLTNSRVLGVIGLAALAAFLFLGAESLELAAMWAGVAAIALAMGGGLFWLGRRAWRKRGAARLADSLVVGAPGENDASNLRPSMRNDVAVLRKGMLEAISTINPPNSG